VRVVIERVSPCFRKTTDEPVHSTIWRWTVGFVFVGVG
jgi:hypothetical protein